MGRAGFEPVTLGLKEDRRDLGKPLRRDGAPDDHEITWLSKHLGHRKLEITASSGHWERAEQRKQAEQMECVFGV